jgi:hypothetical protein
MAKEICPHAEGGCVLAFGPWCFTCYEGIGIESSKKAQSERLHNQYNTGDKNGRTNLIWWRVRVNHLQIISLDRRYFLTCEWCCMGTYTLIKSLYFTLNVHGENGENQWNCRLLMHQRICRYLAWLQKSQPVTAGSDHSSRPFSCGDSASGIMGASESLGACGACGKLGCTGGMGDLAGCETVGPFTLSH